MLSRLKSAYFRVMMRTRIQHKLLFASGAAILPLSVLLWFVVSGFGRDIDFAKNELAGLQQLQPLVDIAGEVVHHNRLALDLLRGGTDRSQFEASQRRSDRDFAALTRLSSSASWFPPLRSQWLALRAAGANTTAAWLAAQHTRLFRAAHEAMRQVGDDSGLVLDSDLDSYYLVDIITHRLPAIQTMLNDVAGIAGRMAEDPGESAANDYIALRLEGSSSTGRLRTPCAAVWKLRFGATRRSTAPTG